MIIKISQDIPSILYIDSSCQLISNGGVFIETNGPFYAGQGLKLNFSLPEVESPISIGGEVVRVDSRGIGVKFISGDIHKLDIN